MGRGPRSEEALQGTATSPRRGAAVRGSAGRAQAAPAGVDPLSGMSEADLEMLRQAAAEQVAAEEAFEQAAAGGGMDSVDPRTPAGSPYDTEDPNRGSGGSFADDYDDLNHSGERLESARDVRIQAAKDILGRPFSRLRDRVRDSFMGTAPGQKLGDLQDGINERKQNLAREAGIDPNQAGLIGVWGAANEAKRQELTEIKIVKDTVGEEVKRQKNYHSDLARLQAEAEAGNQAAADLVELMDPSWVDRRLAEQAEPTEGDIGDIADQYSQVFERGLEKAEAKIEEYRFAEARKKAGGRLKSTRELGLSDERVVVSHEEAYQAQLAASQGSRGGHGAGGMGGDGGMGGFGQGRRSGHQRPSGMPQPSRRSNPTDIELWYEEFHNFLVS